MHHNLELTKKEFDELEALDENQLYLFTKLKEQFAANDTLTVTLENTRTQLHFDITKILTEYIFKTHCCLFLKVSA